jgi:hypothetical protein
MTEIIWEELNPYISQHLYNRYKKYAEQELKVIFKKYPQMQTHKLQVNFMHGLTIGCRECSGVWEIDGGGDLIKETFEHEYLSCDEVKIKYIIK